jgi:hypothetical protein
MYESSFLVSHANVISVYDLRLNRWVQHLKMNEEVLKIINFEENANAFLKNFQTIRIEGDANYNYIGNQNLMGHLEVHELTELKQIIDEKKLNII